MAIKRARIVVKSSDDVLKRFANQLGALGQGKARVAMARAVNHGGAKTYTAVKRALIKQTSAPRKLVDAALRTKKAAQKGNGDLAFIITGRGSEIPLNFFQARQFSFGVRARVWGRLTRFPGMFGAEGDNPKVVAKLGGRIFHRTSSKRLPIEESYGPSLPKEMLLGQTKATFQEQSRANVEARLAHEIGRLLPG